MHPVEPPVSAPPRSAGLRAKVQEWMGCACSSYSDDSSLVVNDAQGVGASTGYKLQSGCAVMGPGSFYLASQLVPVPSKVQS